MKYILTTLLLLTLTTDNFGQGKSKRATKEIKTDTVDLFQQVDNKVFKEKNTFWADKNEIGLIQTSWYNTDYARHDGGYSIELTVIFYNWDSVELDKEYNLDSLKTECRLKGHFWLQNYNTPTGQIRLVKKTKDRLTFYFNIQALSTDKEKFLVYKGERTFKPDY